MSPSSDKDKFMWGHGMRWFLAPTPKTAFLDLRVSNDMLACQYEGQAEP